MTPSFNRRFTLQQLEKTKWEIPTTYPTSLVQKCTELYRNRPLEAYTASDLQIMLTQQFSPQYLVPLALELIESNPMIEGRYYPGDLLFALLRLPASVWEQQKNDRYRLQAVVDTIRSFYQEFEKMNHDFGVID
ncbi:hypothetical protein SAMN05444392_106154 [Seinonella peptonophila]|uniref:Uncharacterized protein n=1 Tax=Seinonella peptonophila TaxID=112248 RepID=A0A1M4YCC5_9BACL|nr:contact-dependent growth inhibition system immunity protein [Seinonella peptonophila]SHF03196.1 hypothetical protein SAMN05444392_106154 [Seinonella peptonophila]